MYTKLGADRIKFNMRALSPRLFLDKTLLFVIKKVLLPNLNMCTKFGAERTIRR